jgi:nicotinate-nucleotide--dimethylbenzimidazole phosphoribosyltransferase
MDSPTWRRALVLGGIRSGKSELAEELVLGRTGAMPLYVATARRLPDDPGWNARLDAHRARRGDGWSTVEVGEDPSALPALLRGAAPTDVLLVDDLGTWLGAVMDVTPDGLSSVAAELSAAVRACLATLVLVSPEVGLSLVPANEAARRFADGLGLTNRAVAAACDAVVLVIAGNAVPVKGGL